MIHPSIFCLFIVSQISRFQQNPCNMKYKHICLLFLYIVLYKVKGGGKPNIKYRYNQFRSCLKTLYFNKYIFYEIYKLSH